LRDYLYIPLGGNKKGKRKTYINLMITMLLGGLWHGASWNFVIYGGLHGIYLSIHRMFFNHSKAKPKKIEKLTFSVVLSIFFTFLLVTFSRIFFRSTSWSTTELFFSRIYNWESSEYNIWFFTTTFTYLAVIYTLDILEYSTGKHTYLLDIKSKPFRYAILSGFLILTVFFMFQTKTTPFIYFKF
ncbi:MAG TPA: MBOAT family O-acyltransferase, partial [Chitinophagales bacterium]|nr:MBOAT family O-acyltransferase [Chitinophagales bacterium]